MPIGFKTTLADVGGISDVATSLTLASSAGAPTAPFVILIEAEYIRVGARTGTACSALVRGIDGTTAAAHAQNVAIVQTLIPQALFDVESGDLMIYLGGALVARAG